MSPPSDTTDPAPPADRSGAFARLIRWLGLVVVLLCIAYVTHLRGQQIHVWHDDAQRYWAGKLPMMTTLDAFYSLHLARLQAAGTFVPHGPAPLRHYTRPEAHDPNTWYEQRQPKSLPLLSRLIAAVSPAYDGGVDEAGFKLPPLLASVFLLPLFLYFAQLGHPVAGLMGGLVATLSVDYWLRTSLGWVDTDCLNLFFPWLVASMILIMRPPQSSKDLLVRAALVGLSLNLYHLWYGKSEMTLAFLVALAAHLVLAGVRWRMMAACVLLALLCSNPVRMVALAGSLAEHVERYVISAPAQPSESGAALPSPWSTIGEMRHRPVMELLGGVAGHAALACAGLAGFVMLAIRRWRAMVALSPVALLGAMALMSSARFVIYLAPFAGIGLGYLITLVMEKLSARTSPMMRTGIGGAVAVGFAFVVLAPQTLARVEPQPALPAPIYKQLKALATQVAPETRVWTWWDLGFAITDTTGLGVYHDGAAQYTAQTNLIATGLAHPDQTALHEIIRYVDREGNRGLHALRTQFREHDALLREVRRHAGAMGSTPIVVLFTPDMIEKFWAIHHMSVGVPGSGATTAASGIRRLACQSATAVHLLCGQRAFNLESGAILDNALRPLKHSEHRQLKRVVRIESGHGVDERELDPSAALTLQVLHTSAGFAGAYLLDETAFRSNLNQMYLLGRYDPARFVPFLEGYPGVRAFKVVIGAASTAAATAPSRPSQRSNRT